MARDYVSVARYEREGRLVVQGGADMRGRPDAVEFRAPSGQRLVDWLGEVFVWIDRWPTRRGVAVLLQQVGSSWEPVATTLWFDALYITREQRLKLVFGAYVELASAVLYRLHLPGAVVTRPVVGVGALQREPKFDVDAFRARQQAMAGRTA